MADSQVVCSVCGYELGPKEEEIGEGGHFSVVEKGEDDTRLRCKETGSLASPQEKREHEREEMQNESNTPPSDTGKPSKQEMKEESGRSPRKDLTKQEFDDPDELLLNVISSPQYDLSKAQVAEVQDWMKYTDGPMDPNQLNEIIADFDGISNQSASLIARKYGQALHKWRMNEQDTSGPPIGLGMGGIGGGGQRKKKKQPQPQKKPKKPSTEREKTAKSKSKRKSLKRERKKRRVERREDIKDEIGMEMAKQYSQRMGRGFDFLHTLFMSKAESDPDWFFERAEEMGVDILGIMEDFAEPSEAKKEKMQGGGKSGESMSVDKELEQAVNEVEKEENGYVDDSDNVGNTDFEENTVQDRIEGMDAEDVEESIDDAIMEEEEVDESGGDDELEEMLGGLGGEN